MANRKRASKTASVERFRQLPPGTDLNVYTIGNPLGQQIGWYIVVGNKDVSQGGYTWVANQAYWFWWVSAFPDSFGLTKYGTTVPSGCNPAYASPITTSGPFNTSTTYTPATLPQWWQLSYVGGADVGYLGRTAGGNQYWYEINPNPYIPMPDGTILSFQSASQPSTAMYRCVDTRVD